MSNIYSLGSLKLWIGLLVEVINNNNKTRNSVISYIDSGAPVRQEDQEKK